MLFAPLRLHGEKYRVMHLNIHSLTIFRWDLEDIQPNFKINLRKY